MKERASIYYWIFILTVFDILFTAIGLKLGIIEEANPIMRYLFNFSIILSGLFVIMFVGLLLVFLYKVRNRIEWLYKALIGVVILKLWVMILHVEWIVLSI